MFEQSMCVVSCGGAPGRGSRWTFAGSIMLQSCVAATLIVLPLLHPERMSLSGAAPKAFVPLSVSKPREVKVREVEASRSTAHAAAATASPARLWTAPARIPRGIAEGDPPPSSVTGTLDGLRGALPGAVVDVGASQQVAEVARSQRPAPLRISSGIGSGMLVAPIRPMYPEIARVARVQGTVVVAATISRDGVLERAHVVSGPPMLAGAAIDAVRAARYTPYRLNGVPVEVETTVTVNFRLGS